jgi:hypothetical protein
VDKWVRHTYHLQQSIIANNPFFSRKKKIKNYEIAILTMKLGNNLHLRCDYKI